MFLINVFLQGGVVSTSPNPQAGGPPLVGCPRLLIQFIRSYPPYRRPFLYPQPEDAPWRGDRDFQQVLRVDSSHSSVYLVNFPLRGQFERRSLQPPQMCPFSHILIRDDMYCVQTGHSSSSTILQSSCLPDIFCIVV